MVLVEAGGAFSFTSVELEITLKQSVLFAVQYNLFCLMKWHIWAQTCITSHLYICLSLSAVRSFFSNRLTSINLQLFQSESCRFISSERICLMSASYWIWISFIILFLILKVTLAFVLISSWYAGPIALGSLLLLLGRSNLDWLLRFQRRRMNTTLWSRVALGERRRPSRPLVQSSIICKSANLKIYGKCPV